MSKLKSWFQKTITNLLEPDREQDITNLVNVLNHAIQVRGREFRASTALAGLDFTQADYLEARIRVYRSSLERGWADGVLTEGEQRVAAWLADRLELPANMIADLNYAAARNCFGSALAQAMEDGILDQNELARLELIAASVGCKVPDFTRRFFAREGEAFLRSIFLACVADNHISNSDWQYLLSVTRTLGLTHEEMLIAVQPQAKQFVEHVLADIKSDGSVSQQELNVMNWLLANLSLPDLFARYVREEIEQILSLQKIENGILPSLTMPHGMEYKSGEIVHWSGGATWRETRALKNGPRTDSFSGILVLTDNRLVFSSQLKSHSISYRKIVSHRGGGNWAEVQVQNKPFCQYHLAQPSPTFYPILRTAIAMANQTKVAKQSEEYSRHIPREVRQRVWQKYGGQCAECASTSYLEFDHIIPHARGGSNGDNNIQLLCRMCNLKKSDMI
jgi:hypothetical protein